jgi:hypothetical protein
MTKVQKIINKVVSPVASISLINEEFNRTGMSQLIDTELGDRLEHTGYSYSEIIRNHCNIFYSGGDCAEDIQQHLGEYLKQIPGNNVPSADTILRGLKELSVDNTIITSKQKKEYQFNVNTRLNRLNIKSLLLTGQLKKGEKYDFDYDNQIIVHEKYDAKPTYKKTKGYFPGIATIGDKIVYIENRDGNANVKTGQAETLTRAYQLLEKQGIKISRSRMDAGSYSQDIIEVVSKYSDKFYIRANKCDSLYHRIREIMNWETVEINDIVYEVSSLTFTQFHIEKGYRLVIMRQKSNDPQLDLFTGDNFNYRSILTDDWMSTEKEVIEYYNQRGASEKTFDIQNNDFGWKHLPFSDMHHNTVYLIIMAIAKNFYNHIITKVSAVFTDIKPTSRLKRFIFRFIAVSGKWIYRGRQWILQLYTRKPYEKVFRQ